MPVSWMEPMSPPLALTASPQTGCPVSGSGSSNFKLVFPPPGIADVRVRPQQVRAMAGCRPSFPREFRSTVFQACGPSLISFMDASAVLLKSFGVSVPLIGF
jgi:hypothetical protein